LSRCLVVLFAPVEATAGAAFAQCLAMPFDLLALKGEVPTNLGAEKIFRTAFIENPPADGLAQGLRNVAQPYTHIASVSSMQAKDVMARLAGLLDCGMVTDAIAACSPTEFKRPVVAGSMIATVEVLSIPVVITFRPAGFGKPQTGGESKVEMLDWTMYSKAKRISTIARGGTRPDLTQAKVVVSGGRPLKDAATFESVIGGLADALGGAAGATRAAVDSGIAPNELQVGQTGKIVAPDLYIAAGISGSTQHMAGIKDRKIIVAINKDPDEPIFEAADLGIVADLYDAIPALRELIGK